MEQIAVKVHSFRLFENEPIENDFSMIVYLNSDGMCKSESHYSTKNFPDFMPMKEWRLMQMKNGNKAISFRYLANYLDIIDADQLDIAIPFFEKHLSHLKQA